MKLQFEPLVAWYDLWVGAYWDREERVLTVMPIPCVGFQIRFSKQKPEEGPGFFEWVVMRTGDDFPPSVLIRTWGHKVRQAQTDRPPVTISASKRLWPAFGSDGVPFGGKKGSKIEVFRNGELIQQYECLGGLEWELL